MDKMRSPIELRHLRYLIAAARCGSFRKAATELGVRVSSMSRRIRDLEDEIGATLFIRHRSGVRLTQAGEIFLWRAQSAIGQLSSAERDVGAIGRGEHGAVRVGVSTSMASDFLAMLMKVFSAEYSGVQLDFFEGSPTEQIQAIRSHGIDVAFMLGSPKLKYCETVDLWTEEVVIVMPHGDPLADLGQVTWKDLRGRHFIVSEAWPGPEVHDFLVRHLGELGSRPSIEFQSVYQDTLMQIVASGRGLTLTSGSKVAMRFPGVAYRYLTGEVLPYSAVWSAENRNPAFHQLLSVARELTFSRRVER